MADVVHILHLGLALCGKSGNAGTWEPGHKWVGLRTEATCDACLRAADVLPVELMARQFAERPLTAEEERAAALRAEAERQVATAIREQPKPSQRDFRALSQAIDAALNETEPSKIDEAESALRLQVERLRPAIDADFPNNPLDEVFREHGEALLRALFAWRGQGSITRWKTKISRRLAHLVDRIGRDYPGATGELQKAGVADAVDDVLSAAARRRTPKGFAAELTRLRDELGSLGQLVDDLADYAHEAADDEPPAPIESSLPATGDERARRLIERADRGDGRQDVKLVADYLRRTAAAEDRDG